MAENMNLQIFLNVMFAGIIAFGVVYNSARVSLSERERELASLRVLGFTRGEISLILLGELAVLTLLALPVGAVIGYVLGQIIMTAFNNEVYRLSFVIRGDDRLVVSDRHRRRRSSPACSSGGGSTGSISSAVLKTTGVDADAPPAAEHSPAASGPSLFAGAARRRAVARRRSGRCRGGHAWAVGRHGRRRRRDARARSVRRVGTRGRPRPSDRARAGRRRERGSQSRVVRPEAPPLLDARTRAEAEAAVESARRRSAERARRNNAHERLLRRPIGSWDAFERWQRAA